MELKVEREQELKVSHDELRSRLWNWANRTGFKCTSDLQGSWTFARGTHLGAMLRFDARKYPIEAVIRNDDGRGVVFCSIRVKAPFAMQTSGDLPSLQELLDVLVGNVKGAI